MIRVVGIYPRPLGNRKNGRNLGGVSLEIKSNSGFPPAFAVITKKKVGLPKHDIVASAFYHFIIILAKFLLDYAQSAVSRYLQVHEL